jgi:hypothetical protein
MEKCAGFILTGEEWGRIAQPDMAGPHDRAEGQHAEDFLVQSRAFSLMGRLTKRHTVTSRSL